MSNQERLNKDLFEAISNRDFMDFLNAVEKGADINCVQNIGSMGYLTPLAYAMTQNWRPGTGYMSSEDYYDILETILDHAQELGLNVNTKIIGGKTIAHLLCSENTCLGGNIGVEKMFKMLMARKDELNLDINARDNVGQTPLHLAALNSQIRIFIFLLNNRHELGLDVTVKNDYGKNIMQCLYTFEERKPPILLREAVKLLSEALEEVGYKEEEDE